MISWRRVGYSFERHLLVLKSKTSEVVWRRIVRTKNSGKFLYISIFFPIEYFVGKKNKTKVVKLTKANHSRRCQDDSTLFPCKCVLPVKKTERVEDYWSSPSNRNKTRFIAFIAWLFTHPKDIHHINRCT